MTACPHLRFQAAIAALALALLPLAMTSASTSPVTAANGSPIASSDAGRVFVVGHNSGRSLAATANALLHGADLIEIDVRSLRGELVSAHSPIAVWGELNLFLGPTVEEVWRASSVADAIQLDLKESSPAFIELVAAFLRMHAGEFPVMLASYEASTLEQLADVSPDVVPFLTVSSRSRLTSLLDESATTCLPFGGVTVREELLDAASIASLHAAGLLVFAWTVNDHARAFELVELGVDAITTDDVQLMELLGGTQPGERDLREAPLLAPACA
jgi:glycerophosphoryl diester phosphodiesterase